jgi:hypothetical protein
MLPETPLAPREVTLMSAFRRLPVALAVAGLGLLALAPAPAKANVHVSVGVGVPLFAWPFYYQPRPYYYPPAYYYQPPAYYAPPPSYYPPQGSPYQPPQVQQPPAAQGPCREYDSTIYVGGQPQHAYGTACQQPDGSWQIQN